MNESKATLYLRILICLVLMTLSFVIGSRFFGDHKTVTTEHCDKTDLIQKAAGTCSTLESLSFDKNGNPVVVCK